MAQAERVAFNKCLNEEELIRGNGHIKELALAKEAIRQAYVVAYRRGWRPERFDSAMTTDLSATLAEAYERINGRLLDQLADDSDLVKIREGIIKEIRSGTFLRN